MSTSPKRLAALASATLAIAGITVLAPSGAEANPAGTDLVISEVYGAGGNSGAAFKADFVELFNPTDDPIDLLGRYVAYRSATGGLGGAMALRGTLDAGDHYLVQMSAAGTNGADLPAPDRVASPAINMAAAGGQVLLTDGFGPFTRLGDLAGAAGVTDMVGLDVSAAGANSFETAAGPAATATQSANRAADGTDTDDNSADFSLAAPTPTVCGCVPAAGLFSGSIADIQGTGDTSPHLDETVTTNGVVTARYPAGGFNGFFMQTAGTGGAVDGTPGASDAIFVFTPTFDDNTVALGDGVTVVGTASEFAGQTQITATTVTKTAPATVTAWSAAYPTTNDAREDHEGEILAPTNTFTVTNTFATNTFGEIGLATGTTPLIQPTDAEAPGPDADAVAANNAERGVVLDDGSSNNYTGSASGTAAPWLNNPVQGFNPVRVGARATLPAVTSASVTDGVILDFRNNVWKFQPQAQVTNNGAGVATFVNTRTNQPRGVGGDLKLATFNVLNYFNTTGEAWNATHPGDCSFFNDRQGNPITVNDCTSDNGPRGAANDANLARQQIKIVRAINAMDADIVGLEEIENSVALGEDRDDALAALVAALNVDAGFERWKFAPSPAAADLPDVADQDVIRTAFIFNPDTVTRVGQSEVLSDSAAFANAREPLAQAFKFEAAPDDETFAVVVNHFKSKSDSSPPQRGNDNEDVFDGQGAFNGDRTRQAEALVDFANGFAADRGTDRIFLAGDFNSYTFEDPMQVLYDAGFINIESDVPAEKTYSFSGLSGSLDHIVASPEAFADVTGADIWNINSGESIAFEYSRFNNNITNFHQANVYRSSDHDPEIIGIERPGNAVEKIQVLGTNDFHGRINRNPIGAEAGAAVLAGAVQHFRGINPDTVFAAAGDLIGASTFESFILNDKPTIDALNEAGLDVSAVGNHEFDQGYDDLVNRVMAPYDIDDNPFGGAEWTYLGANVRFKDTAEPALEETWVRDFGDVEVGFVGAVTEHLPELVSPDGIADIEVTNIVEAANREANELKADGVDIVILLVHEGAATTALSSATDPASDFGKIVNGVNKHVDGIISGHTHLAYNHRIPVKQWQAEGRTVTRRPVVSAGQYGYNLNRLNFRFNTNTDELVGISQSIVPLQSGDANWTANFPADPTTAAIVQEANDKAEVLGAQTLGKIAGPYNRARTSTNAENRGGESPLGNLVAEVQRWATESPTTGSAQIAFMNPGGLRQDMVPAPDGTLTYRAAANVQPFANTLVNMDLTGAQIKQALEQQWQPAGAARPFLRLGASQGFTYTYDDSLPAGSRITYMWLNGTPIDLGATYSVTVNSFLAAGGDNFGAFAGGTGKQDTGQSDLQAMVAYMAQFGTPGPLEVDYSQRAVGVKLPAGAPASYTAGDHVKFGLTSLAMTTAADVDGRDNEVEVSLNGTSLGSFPVDNTIGTAIFDEHGTASVDVVVPAGTPGGPATLLVEGDLSGTVVRVPITVAGGTPPAPTPVGTTVSGAAESFAYGKTGALAITVSPATAAGTVAVTTDKGVALGTATITGGSGSLALAAKGLKPGTHTLTLAYAGNSTHKASTGTVSVVVTKATPTVKVKRDKTVQKGDESKVVVKVTAPDGIVAKGKVKLVIKGTGKSFTAKVVDGKAVFELPAYAKADTYTLRVKYLGTTVLESVTKKVNVTVVK